MGTHVVSAGPLASGSVGMGAISHTKTGLTHDRIFTAGGSGSSDPLSHLKSKSRTTKSLTPFDSDSEDEFDLTKIDMSKEYQYEDSETVLFPVRPEKDENPDVSAPSASALAASSRPETAEVVKSETPEEVKTDDENFNIPKDPVERGEYDRLLDDQRAILDLVTAKLGDLKTDESDPEPTENKYVLFQLPQVVPQEETEQVVSKSDFAGTGLYDLEGQVGQLNFHRSGKISITLGESTTLDVAQGVPSSFLQELFVVDSHAARKDPEDEDENEMLDEEGVKIVGNIFRLGEVTGKIVGTPAL